MSRGQFRIAVREGDEARVVDMIRSARYSETARNDLERLMTAAGLDGRERMAMEMRGAKKMRVEEVGQELDCCARTVNRIQRSALDKMGQAYAQENKPEDYENMLARVIRTMEADTEMFERTDPVLVALRAAARRLKEKREVNQGEKPT